VVVRDRAEAIALAPLLAGTQIALEITSSIDGFVDLIAETVEAYPTPGVIAGTITDAETGRAAARAGARALVSPHVVPDLPKAVDVLTILGALTPTEVTTAAAAGAAAVKVFPVSAVGGVSYLRALRGPYPSLPLVPSGGIQPDEIGDYFAAGAAAVGLGSRSLTRGGDPAAMIEKLSRILAEA
jgi:2-dehydro-3-deoxyphosphogluconate aldolase/(4S)-4-hydroxy-2-oxoglutarate aldolase